MVRGMWRGAGHTGMAVSSPRDDSAAGVPGTDGRVTMEAQDERAVHSTGPPSPGALTYLSVIELADEQAEYCGLVLAGLGAEVIKVEPPAAAPHAASGPSTKIGTIPSAPCSSGSTTVASARSCSICTSRPTATSSARSLPRPTCCWSPRPGASWTGSGGGVPEQTPCGMPLRFSWLGLRHVG
jgi:hypothetical protein